MNKEQFKRNVERREALTSTYSRCKIECLLEIEQEFPEMSQEQMHKIFTFAWDKGHSYGVQEVKIWVDELLDLFRK